jgi:hypothetical protein
MKRLMVCILFAAAVAVPVQAHADSFQACTPPQHMNNFGIPIAATPSLWVNPSCAGPQSGRRCAWTHLPRTGDGCINYPPVASPVGNVRAAGTPD